MMRVARAVRTAVAAEVAGLSVFVLTFLMSLAIRLVGVPGDPAQSVEADFAAVGLSQLALWIWLYLVTRVLAKITRVPLPFVYASILLAGALRGVLVQGLVTGDWGDLSGLFAMRVASSVVIFTVLIIASSYAVFMFKARFRVLRDLRLVRATLISELEHNQVKMDSWYAQLVSDVQQMLAGALQRDINLEGEELSTALKSLVSDVLRPMSHGFMERKPEFATESKEEAGNLSVFRELAKLTTTFEWRTHPFYVGLASSLATSSYVIQFFGLTRIPGFLGGVTTLALGYLLANRVFTFLSVRASIATRVTVFTLTTVMLGLPGSILAMWVTDTFLDWKSLGGALLLSFGVSLVALLITLSLAVPKAAQLDQDNLERANEQLRWLVARSNAEMWQKQRTLSTFLHGQVQNSISAAVIRFDMARSNEQDIAVAATQARNTSTSAIESIANPPEAHLFLDDAFDSIALGWDGVCKVSIEVAESLNRAINTDPSCSRLTVDIIQESIANAIRHGKSDAVQVSLSLWATNEVQIEITDNGLGLPAEIDAGLGTKLLNDCAISWSRVNTQTGVRLLCLVPLTESIVELSGELNG